MKTRRRLVTSLVSALFLVLVAVAWIAFAPTRLGGQVSYIIVNGNSMEPGMHRGDLAVVRRSHTYSEGDIVTYHHPDIGPVIHRIIGHDGEHYVFKGDHNTFADGYQPVESGLIGELWFHVPSAGKLLEPFQDQRYAAVLIVLAIVGLGGGAGAAKRKKQDQNGRHPAGVVPERRTVMQSLTRNWQDAFVTLGAAAFACLILAIVAFGRPTTRQVPDNVSFTQSGEFTYAAASSDGEIYDAAVATTGDPIFRRLSDSLAVRFSYTFASKAAADVHGTGHLVAEIGDTNGWKRTIELAPVTPFQGTSFVSEGVLQLAEVQSLIERLEAETGVRNESYTLTIAPLADLAGTIAGRELNEQFAPRLAFKFDAFQLSLPPHNPSEADPLRPSSEGLSNGTRIATNEINLLFVSLGVPTARWLSLFGLGVVMAGAGLFIFGAIRCHGPAGESPADVQAKYGLPVVTVHGVPAPRSTVIDVTSIDDLALVAEREGCLILQEGRPGFRAYFVQAGAVTYRYQAMGGASRSVRTEAAA